MAAGLDPQSTSVNEIDKEIWRPTSCWSMKKVFTGAAAIGAAAAAATVSAAAATAVSAAAATATAAAAAAVVAYQLRKVLLSI